MLLIVDKSGNVVPAASIQFGGRILHAGNNVWRVSQAGVPLTNEYVNTVTSPFTVSRLNSLTQEEATRILTATRLRFATIWEATHEFTKDKFRELTKEVTDDANGTAEKTVTVGATDFTVTKNLSASHMVTEYLTKEKTVTRLLSADLSKPGATVTNVVTREITVTNPANISLSVSYYPWATRGSNFTFSIQYYKVTGDDWDDYEELEHTPGQALTISQVSNPTGDTFTPTTVDTSGWSNGFKEVTGCLFSGGTGSGVQTLRVTDPELGMSLDFDINLNANQSTKSPGTMYYFYANDSEYASHGGDWDYEPDDWDAYASSLWSSMQSDLLSSFDADTSMSSGSANGTVAQHFIQDVYPYLHATCNLYGGYVSIYISDTDKENLLATHLRVTPKAYLSYGNYLPWGTYIWSPYCNRFTLKIKFTESDSSFGSGNALRNMSSPDISMSFSEIKTALVERGATPTSNTDIYIPFPKSVIENMTGNYLYVWVYVHQVTKSPYSYPYFRATIADQYQEGRQYMNITNVRVELTK